MLCSAECPCAISNEQPYAKLNTDVNHLLQIKPTGYKRYLDCPTQTLSRSHEYSYAKFLEVMETKFDCAGICNLPDFYMFSDINRANGPPKVTCKDFAIDYMRSNNDRYTSLTICASAVGLVGLILSISILYYTNNKLEHSWEKYQQMRFA